MSKLQKIIYDLKKDPVIASYRGNDWKYRAWEAYRNDAYSVRFHIDKAFENFEQDKNIIDTAVLDFFDASDFNELRTSLQNLYTLKSKWQILEDNYYNKRNGSQVTQKALIEIPRLTKKILKEFDNLRMVISKAYAKIDEMAGYDSEMFASIHKELENTKHSLNEMKKRAKQFEQGKYECITRGAALNPTGVDEQIKEAVEIYLNQPFDESKYAELSEQIETFVNVRINMASNQLEATHECIESFLLEPVEGIDDIFYKTNLTEDYKSKLYWLREEFKAIDENKKFRDGEAMFVKVLGAYAGQLSSWWFYFDVDNDALFDLAVSLETDSIIEMAHSAREGITLLEKINLHRYNHTGVDIEVKNKKLR